MSQVVSKSMISFQMSQPNNKDRPTVKKTSRTSYFTCYQNRKRVARLHQVWWITNERHRNEISARMECLQQIRQTLSLVAHVEAFRIQKLAPFRWWTKTGVGFSDVGVGGQTDVCGSATAVCMSENNQPVEDPRSLISGRGGVIPPLFLFSLLTLPCPSPPQSGPLESS